MATFTILSLGFKHFLLTLLRRHKTRLVAGLQKSCSRGGMYSKLDSAWASWAGGTPNGRVCCMGFGSGLRRLHVAGLLKGAWETSLPVERTCHAGDRILH